MLSTEFLSKNSSAQKVLKLENFLELVAKNHPIAKQAQMRVDMSTAELFAAKGMWGILNDLEAIALAQGMDTGHVTGLSTQVYGDDYFGYAAWLLRLSQLFRQALHA